MISCFPEAFAAKRVIPVLIRELADEHSPSHAAAFAALRRYFDAARPALVALAERAAATATERQRALGMLLRAAPDAATLRLTMRVVDDKTAPVSLRRYATEGLGAHANAVRGAQLRADTMATLGRAAEGEEFLLRLSALLGIAAFHDDAVPSPATVIAALDDKLWQLRVAAARAVTPADVARCSRKFLPRLKARRCRFTETREYLAAFARMRPTGPLAASLVPVLRRQWPPPDAPKLPRIRGRLRVLDLLPALGTEAAGALDLVATALADHQWQVRVAALLAVASIGMPAKKLQPRLLELLREPQCAQLAARALHTWGEDEAVLKSLLPRFEFDAFSSEAYAIACVEALAEVDASSATHARIRTCLTTWYHATGMSDRPRAVVLRGLGRHEGGLAFARKALANDRDVLRAAAVEILGEVGDASDLQRLTELRKASVGSMPELATAIQQLKRRLTKRRSNKDR